MHESRQRSTPRLLGLKRQAASLWKVRRTRNDVLAKMPDKSFNPFRVTKRPPAFDSDSDGIAAGLGSTKFDQDADEKPIHQFLRHAFHPV
jgi:hypothetical protein